MSSLLLPQLPDTPALPLLAELALCSDPTSLQPTGELRHSQAYPGATGGLPVGEPKLRELREQIVAAAREHGFPTTRPRSFLAFEFRVAEILATWEPLWINGAPSGESLRHACWTFLTVIVLPDVAVWRWPISAGREDDKAWKVRMLGGGRNAFQRIFRRVMSLDRGVSHPDRWGLIRDLREDDFSNILERPSLGSNPHIAVCLGEEYMAMRERLKGFSAEIQTSVYRDATKDLRAYGVVQCLDLLPRADLEELMRRTFLRREDMHVPRKKEDSATASPTPAPGQRRESQPPEPTSPTTPAGPPVSDQPPPPPSRRSSRPGGLLRRLLGGG